MSPAISPQQSYLSLIYKEQASPDMLSLPEPLIGMLPVILLNSSA